MWFIDVEVEQETSAPPPEKNPGSAPVLHHLVDRDLSGGHRFPPFYQLAQFPQIVNHFEEKVIHSALTQRDQTISLFFVIT